MDFTDVAAEKKRIVRMHDAIARGTGSKPRQIVWIEPDDPNQTPYTDMAGNTTHLPEPRTDWGEHEVQSRQSA